MDLKYKDLQRKLRKNMPAPELILWQKIRGKQLGVKFRRQYVVEIPHPSSPFERGKSEKGVKKVRILDFYAPSIKLGIEIDGDSHFKDDESRKRELIRDKELFKNRGIKVIRFLNTEIMENIEGVLTIILKEINPPSNSPLYFVKRGEIFSFISSPFLRG